MGTPSRDATTAELAELATGFESMRPRLFGIAYRMLGSAVEAEDVLQDAWIKWQTTDRSAIRSHAAFLTTMTTRLAINVATSARVRRETYIGPWLPEPVLTGTDPELGAENTEALEIGLLLLMERLTPKERAVYLLHEAFDYSFSDIAAVIETTEANARQLARRARLHLQDHSDTRVSVAQKNRLLRSFLAAAQAGDLAGLQTLLADDIIIYSDGGGIVSAARRPVEGRDRVGRFLLGTVQKLQPGAQLDITAVNGADAFVIRQHGEPYLVGSLGVSAEGIHRIFFVLNPEKLGAVRSVPNESWAPAVG
ncbi:RNA polymerase sigma-70 factor [Cryobacterium sp. SO2]|uniref:RNA polymerase sigma-70 factor n=1 Tax=Cryobacterium sp. SO2 TaxID=1897060 RepID=UPI00223E6E89|nr:RNA polymerase sigma-70 factor [Cryobacterium sp. SO2]WEO78779.1 RNA polymerase sigma-70 factor [Cryobacterium sp. SO2]